VALGVALLAALPACTPVSLDPEEEGVVGDDGKADGPVCSEGTCYDRCSYGTYPLSGCDESSHCERRTIGGTTAEVCISGDWAQGLQLSDDGTAILGRDTDGAAEPYGSLAGKTCSGSFGQVDKDLFFGLANTLLALGSKGRSLSWERLCSTPSGLPRLHDVSTEAAAGRAFRLSGDRTSTIERAGIALYGIPLPRTEGLKGPLWKSRVMIYSSSGKYYLYADGAADHPSSDGTRGRHFSVVNGEEWVPLDSAVDAATEYRLFKRNHLGSYMRQWAPTAHIQWVAGIARAHIETHGTRLGVGDLSLPTGGDIDDHASHETGADCDLYLIDDEPALWLSDCSYSSGKWKCWYTNEDTGAREPTDLDHPAGARLKTLAQYALDNAGLSHFVHNDVTVIAPFRSETSSIKFMDESNVAANGWPAHADHIHIRFH